MYCLNCQTDNPKEVAERHAAPCGRCGSDGHATCQHRGPDTSQRRA